MSKNKSLLSSISFCIYFYLILPHFPILKVQEEGLTLLWEIYFLIVYKVNLTQCNELPFGFDRWVFSANPIAIEFLKSFMSISLQHSFLPFHRSEYNKSVYDITGSRLLVFLKLHNQLCYSRLQFKSLFLIFDFDGILKCTLLHFKIEYLNLLVSMTYLKQIFNLRLVSHCKLHTHDLGLILLNPFDLLYNLRFIFNPFFDLMP